MAAAVEECFRVPNRRMNDVTGGRRRHRGAMKGGANIARVRAGERKDETEERGRENMRRKRKGS